MRDPSNDRTLTTLAGTTGRPGSYGVSFRGDRSGRPVIGEQRDVRLSLGFDQFRSAPLHLPFPFPPPPSSHCLLDRHRYRHHAPLRLRSVPLPFPSPFRVTFPFPFPFPFLPVTSLLARPVPISIPFRHCNCPISVPCLSRSCPVPVPFPFPSCSRPVPVPPSKHTLSLDPLI